MSHETKRIQLFSASSNTALASKIGEALGLRLSNLQISRFKDGEIGLSITETVRGANVFIIQSTCAPVHDNLMELLIIIDAMKRASAGVITAVIPYYGYARQDRKSKARDPISAKLVADLLTTAGANRVLTMDLHAPQIQGFFNIPLDHLLGIPILAPYYAVKFGSMLDNVLAVSPDFGSVTRARSFAQKLDIPIAIIDKRRPRENVAEVLNIIGDVKGKTCILVDDMIDTAGTIISGAVALMECGAKEVYCCCTHAVLSSDAVDKIMKSPIKEMVVLDTIALPPEKLTEKIKVLSVAPVFAEAIERIYEEESVSSLFI